MDIRANAEDWLNWIGLALNSERPVITPATGLLVQRSTAQSGPPAASWSEQNHPLPPSLPPVPSRDILRSSYPFPFPDFHYRCALILRDCGFGSYRLVPLASTPLNLRDWRHKLSTPPINGTFDSTSRDDAGPTTSASKLTPVATLHREASECYLVSRKVIPLE